MAASHANRCWGVLAAGGGATTMLHPRVACVVPGAGVTVVLMGWGGLCPAMPWGQGHQPSGARHLLQVPARASRHAKPNLLSRALCWLWLVKSPCTHKYPVIVFSHTMPAFLMRLLFSCLVCPRLLEKCLLQSLPPVLVYSGRFVVF